MVNEEEGSEKTYAMGDQENDILYEFPFMQEGTRDLAIESMYEYGSRAGISASVPALRSGRHPGHDLCRRGGSRSVTRLWPPS